MIKLRFPATKRDWVAAAAGAAFVAGSGLSLARGFLSLMWPKVDAVVTYSTPKNSRRSYQVDLRYRFAAGGRTHESDRYRFQFAMDRWRMRTRDVDLIQARYPVGERVSVAVNPRDPDDAVLEPGVDLAACLWFGFGLLLLLGGLAESCDVREVRPKTETAPTHRGVKVLAAIGAAVFLFGARAPYEGWSSLHWPTADGKILYSRARVNGTYETLLWYEYYVANRRYVAGNYRTGGNVTPFRDIARAAAKRYPVGRALKVYYNPAQPSEALLEPGVWYGNFVLPAIGILILTIALMARRYFTRAGTQ
jgi:hypothetical protein